MATSPVQDYPLQPELGLINYLRQITGIGTPGSVAVPGQASQSIQAVAGQAPELTQDTLSNIMTEWLRGSGNFLNAMHQQNQSGLYNSSTRRLVANDLTAQAALKAAQAGSAVQQRNAELATAASQTNANNAAQVGQTNARLTTEAALQNARQGVAGQSSKSQMVNTLLAAALNAYNGKNKKTMQPKGQDAQVQTQTSPEATAALPNFAPVDMGAFSPADYSSVNVPQMSIDPTAAMATNPLATFQGQTYFNPADFSVGFDTSGYGMSVDPNAGGALNFADFSGGPVDFSTPVDYSGVDLSGGYTPNPNYVQPID